MEDRLVTVAEFDTTFEAELARMHLENEDIETVVVGGDLVANMPTMPVVRIELQVFEKDLERAMAVLKSVEETGANEDLDEDTDEDPDENTDADFDTDLDEDFDMDFDEEESDQPQ